MIIKFFLIMLLLASCNTETCGFEEVKVADKYIVKNKRCVDACISARFGNFHNNGESWGTGSSSMNGLKETSIFVRVLNYCQDYYKGEKCCAGYKKVEKTHHGEIGICKETSEEYVCKIK